MTFTPRSNPKNRPWPPGDEETLSFGTWLRQQREVREITLREIADASKISLRYLEAFEQDRFDVLPSGIFARGFLRQYARYVGLDPDEVTNRYLSAQHPLEPEDEDPVSPVSRPRPGGSWLYTVLLVLALLVVLVLVALAGFFSEKQRGGDVDLPAASETEGVERLAADALARESELPGEGSGGTSAAGGGTAEPSPPEPPEGAGSPAAVLTTAPPTTTSSTQPPPATLSPTPDRPLVVSLELVEDCWAEIRVDGRRELQRVLTAGEILPIAARTSVVLTLGNAGGVRVRVNGVPYPLDRRRGQVAREVRIDLGTVRSLTGEG